MGIVEYTPQEDMDNLLEKQCLARMYFCRSPFRRALNMRWRHYFKDRLTPKVVAI